MSSIAEKIRNTPDIAAKPYPVPEWDVDLELRAFTMGERAVYMEKIQGLTNEDGTKPKGWLAELQPALLIAACYDPETDEPVFTDADAEWLPTKNGAVVDGIVTEVMKMNGMMGELDEDESAADAGKDDSSPTED